MYVASTCRTGIDTLSCLTNMERIFFHLNKLDMSNNTKFEYIVVTQRK